VACGGQSLPSAAPSTSSAVKSSASPPSSGAATSPAAKSAWDDVVDKGKKEGKVVIYGAWSDVLAAPLKQSFAKAHPGIALEWMPMTGAESVPRLEQEQATGKYGADLFMTGTPAVRLATSKGFVEIFEPPAVKQSPSQFILDPLMDKDGPVIHMAEGQFIVVHSTQVPKGQEPRSWKELEDPKWKGKILLNNPGTSGPGNRWFASVNEVYGAAHARKVIENSIIYKGEFAGQATEIARGEYAVTVPAVASTFGTMIKEGAALRVIEPSDGVLFLMSATALIKNAPHPNAARLFFDFLFTREGQSAIAQMGGGPVRKDVDPIFPEFKVTKLFPGQPTDKKWEATVFVESRAVAQQVMKELGK